jgi:exportin-2 (importin alpha re-exporter)
MPNIGFRSQDEELFEDNPEEWIRRDLEGSDQATRRRAACDLIRSLSRNFEKPITEIFGAHINTALERYKGKWINIIQKF